MNQTKFIRYIKLGKLFEVFFLSAILTILGIRLFLQLNGFPQIGSGPFHIAHLLFGGGFMLISIIGFMTYLNNGAKPFWTLLAGIGYGTFVDEIGKFITRDNNYFYQPTFAIIYVIFILIYLLYKGIEHNNNFSKDEYLVNSISLLEDFAVKNFDEDKREEALIYLKQSDQNNDIVKFLKKIFSKSISSPEKDLDLLDRINKLLNQIYNFFLSKPWFLNAVAFFFVIRSVIYLYTGAYLLNTISRYVLDGTLSVFVNPHRVLPLVQFFALFLQATFTIMGVIIIAKSRVLAYTFFRNAVLVSIIILQVFNFYNNPSEALFSTLGDLLLFGILTYIINHERKYHKSK